jgi:hypothetical protein
MRTYTFMAGRPGGFMNWPGKIITSDWKIRAVAVEMFRRWFGREPTCHWHKDGYMAEASDKRGNYVQIQQLNAYDNVEPDLTRLALPAPAIRENPCPSVAKNS